MLADIIHSEFDKNPGCLNVQLFYDVVGERETVEGFEKKYFLTLTE